MITDVVAFWTALRHFQTRASGVYTTVAGKTFVGGAGAHGQSGVLGGLYYNTFQNFVNPPCASIL